MVADALAPLRCQDISNHDIDYVKQVSLGLIRGRISTIYGMSVWRNDIKYEYMLMFPLQNLTRKELRLEVKTFTYLVCIFFGIHKYKLFLPSINTNDVFNRIRVNHWFGATTAEPHYL